ncbi:hypothetical protein VCRA2110O173_340010 [Vibrio crassostreae]|nr:hypothetical protein VCRA2110O173_340010 [Vibrio crassostreae]CAK2104613.1 hypothetical protein VCRA2113O207_460010 [Vibrio crassostreae]
MSRIVNPLVRNVCSAIFIRSKTAMRVYLIVFTPDYEGIRKMQALGEICNIKLLRRVFCNVYLSIQELIIFIKLITGKYLHTLNCTCSYSVFSRSSCEKNNSSWHCCRA